MALDDKTYDANLAFFEEVDWSKIQYNAPSRDEFGAARARVKKAYATFLGGQDQLQFFMFKPMPWGIYKDIKSKGLDKDTTHEYIVNACVLWPKMDAITINNLDAGVMLTIVQQVLAVSNFLKDPNKSLEMILEV